ncbi:sensor histidine kinase [Lihuaxuella thermophila]|uniref:histidine kinase n=1 Tax=Lihuaxuella thermophila TaxID=1173111 RepID=A0A1H8CC80_9BACL|nr:HAMP domain-containing sensor histidine kinase [Lihuaxuella thermophila]SEM92610.1 His Kinase A (phospho-acceptor) domain-containing protein [Lihuaxuella thermophila]
MKLNGRITWHFLWRSFLVMVLITVYYMGLILVAYNDLSDIIERQTRKYESPRDLLVDVYHHTHIQGRTVKVDSQQLREVAKSRGWVQVLDRTGREIFQYRRPDDIPRRYTPGMLVDYRKKEVSAYQIYTWYHGDYTWIYGVTKPEAALLQEVQKQTSLQGERVNVAPSALAKLSQHHSWLQILDEQGREIFQYHRPAGQPIRYTPGLFAYHEEYESRLIYHSDTLNGKRLTWVIGLPDSDFGTDTDMNQYGAERRRERGEFIFYASMAGNIVIVFLIAFLFGNRLGRPVLHMMDWLQDLARGVYAEPVNRKGVPKSLDPASGKLRRSYRTYREVIEALRQLTSALKQNEDNRLRLEKTREEWIAGISHDLKTPLSSVKGYADLLCEEEYDWNREEIRQYARVIRDKAQYMEELIDDLNLTFRLKNEALPLQRQEQDLVELVRRSVIHLANNPMAADQCITFEPEAEPLYFPVDPKWFQRALNNLLTNASVHNPAGTKISVTVAKRTDKGREEVIISIEDNGRGMDEETRSRLFDRYYRGTHTSVKEAGTGLGMAIADQLIQAHGGRIEIDSSPGKGTKIRIVLRQ